MSDPHFALLRALVDRAGGGEYLEGRTWDWASATFAGQRHRFRLALPPAAQARLGAELAPADFLLPGHFVREIAVVGKEADAVEVEAVTVREA